MSHYDDRRVRPIETPLGPVTIKEKKWSEGESDEHWAYVQDFTFSEFEKDSLNGEIVGELLKQYTIAQRLTSEGYEFHSMMDHAKILWVKYV